MHFSISGLLSYIHNIDPYFKHKLVWWCTPPTCFSPWVWLLPSLNTGCCTKGLDQADNDHIIGSDGVLGKLTDRYLVQQLIHIFGYMHITLRHKPLTKSGTRCGFCCTTGDPYLFDSRSLENKESFRHKLLTKFGTKFGSSWI